MTTRILDLTLPEAERRLAASLAGPWRDLLYVPGEGLTSPLDPGAYRSSFVIVPTVGSAVRLSSATVPALGGELCRLRLEPIERYPAGSLGSFFEPARAGTVYALTPDRSVGAARPPDRAEWCYPGPALATRLGAISRLRALRERGRTTDGSWQADRGLVLNDAEGGECVFLSLPERSEAALLLTAPGLHRALLDPAAPPPPGVTARGLLGYAEWPDDLEITIELIPVDPPSARAAVADPADPV